MPVFQSADGAIGHSSQSSIRSPMMLHGSDNPGNALVPIVFNGTNYRSWSKSVKIALAAKQKLGFINGKITEPDEDSDDYEAWLGVNAMIISWILNSLHKNLHDAFVYVNTAKELWDKLEQRYGTLNGPQEYQIRRQISNMTQGNQSLSTFFTQLCHLWDELDSIFPIPHCTCGKCTCAIQCKIDKSAENSKVMQFLMGLNDSYDNSKNQILMMEPLPSVDRVYSLLLNVENQRSVSNVSLDTYDHNAMAVKPSPKSVDRNFGQKKPNIPREAKLCSHCQKIGHFKETCFLLHGIPDWYNELKLKKKQSAKAHAYMIESSMEDVHSGPKSPNVDEPSAMRDMIQQELVKMMKSGGSSQYANQFYDFAGPEK